jgi:hypothetical protein
MFQTTVSPVPWVALLLVVDIMLVRVVLFNGQGEDWVQGEEATMGAGLDGEG